MRRYIAISLGLVLLAIAVDMPPPDEVQAQRRQTVFSNGEIVQLLSGTTPEDSTYVLTGNPSWKYSIMSSGGTTTFTLYSGSRTVVIPVIDGTSRTFLNGPAIDSVLVDRDATTTHGEWIGVNNP